jgi:predicted GH43/DUF377 family glycosyl hydrolase
MKNSQLPSCSATVWCAASALILAFGAIAAASHTPPFGNWTRLSEEPLLSLQGDGFESAGVFNPAVVKEGGEFVMLYRAQDKNGTSSLGYATSRDGIHFSRRAEPALAAEAAYEKGGGVEDPRLQKMGGLYYLTYTGLQQRRRCRAGQKRRTAMPGDIW